MGDFHKNIESIKGKVDEIAKRRKEVTSPVKRQFYDELLVELDNKIRLLQNRKIKINHA